MFEGHDFSIIIGFRRYFQRIGQALPFGHKRMVPRGDKTVWKVRKKPGSVMGDPAGLPVHLAACSDDIPAKCFRNRLKAEADTENRNAPAYGAANCFNANAGVLRGSRARGNDDRVGSKPQGVRGRQGVVPDNFYVVTEPPDEMNEVPSEAVIVVNHENHSRHNASPMDRPAIRQTVKTCNRLGWGNRLCLQDREFRTNGRV